MGKKRGHQDGNVLGKMQVCIVCVIVALMRLLVVIVATLIMEACKRADCHKLRLLPACSGYLAVTMTKTHNPKHVVYNENKKHFACGYDLSDQS